MSVKTTVENYLKAIHDGGWEKYVAEEFEFVSNNFDQTHQGKQAYIDGAGRFFQSTTGLEIRKMLTDDNQVSLVARYAIATPAGKTGHCDVAEFLTVNGDKLTASAIFFDMKAFEELMKPR